MSDDFGILVPIFTIILIVGLLGSAGTEMSIDTVTIEHEIYSATLPFGVFSVKGSVDGSWSFIGGSFEGDLSGSEIYSVKYLDGDELKTVILDAENTPLKITGRLVLVEHYNETIHVTMLDVFFMPFGEQLRENMKNRPRSHSESWFTIEIPMLPDHEQLTEDWIN